MENKKYIAIFEENGKITWKMNSNIYKNVSDIMNHKKLHLPREIQYTIIHPIEGQQTRKFEIIVLPEYNQYKLEYMRSLDNTMFLDKITNKDGQWTGNFYNPAHEDTLERQKRIMYMFENQIVVNDEFAEGDLPWDVVSDITDFEETDNEEENALNEETFNLSEQEFAGFQEDFVFQFPVFQA